MRKFNPLRHEDKLANTLIEYVGLKYDVRVYCRRCPHNRILWLNALIAWKGAKYRLDRRKMRCTMCYGLGAEFSISDKQAGKSKPE